MELLFRIVRNTLVNKLRKSGYSWARINKILYAIGQDEIVEFTPVEKNGKQFLKLKFGKRAEGQLVQLKNGGMRVLAADNELNTEAAIIAKKGIRGLFKGV